MPFKSEAQRRLCYALKEKGEAGSWNCDEWAKETKDEKLPEHVADGKSKDSKPADKAANAISKLAEAMSEATKALKKKLDPESTDQSSSGSCLDGSDSEDSKPKSRSSQDIVPGGAADDKRPCDFPAKSLQMGADHEREHTVNKDLAKEIAMDHLTDDKDYYKKLEKMEENGEKKAMSRLISLWAKDANLQKLAEVVTSPNRGAGDAKDGVVNFDPSDGLPRARKSSPGAGVMPLSKKLRASSARKALIGATRSTFGVNPTGGSMFGKRSELLNLLKSAADPSARPNFDFSSLGRPFDEEKLKAIQDAAAQGAGKPANPLDAAKSIWQGANSIGKGIVDNANKPRWTRSAIAAYRKYKPLQKQLSDAAGPMSDAFKQTYTGAKNVLGATADSLAGPAVSAGTAAFGPIVGGLASSSNSGAAQPQKPSFVDTVRSPATTNALRGAGSGVYDAARGLFGNEEAMNRVREDVNRPNFTNMRQGFNNFVDRTSKSFDTAKVQWAKEHPLEAAQYALGLKTSPLSSLYETSKAVADRFKGPVMPLVKGLGNYGSSLAAQSEGRRMAAGYTLPALEFFQNNPWAKWALLAGGGLLGGAAISRLMGGGASSAQQQGNPVTAAMNQGYMSQTGPYRNSLNYM